MQKAVFDATAMQNVSKIETLGPYCLCLRSLLFGASEEIFSENFLVYRSFLASKEHLADLLDLT